MVSTRAALMALGHDFQSHPLFGRLKLAHCNSCCRIWARPTVADSCERLHVEWLDLFVPTGWTCVLHSQVCPYPTDFVPSLSIAEALLWNWEPCGGRPRYQDTASYGNSVYRLMALDLVDWRTGKLQGTETISGVADSWGIPQWALLTTLNTFQLVNHDQAIVQPAK